MKIEALLEENVSAECLQGMEKKLKIKYDGARYFMNRIRVLQFGSTKKLVIDEAHKTIYSIHLGSYKLYLGLKNLYWWPNMKAKISTYVSKFLTYSKVKAEHQWPSGL